ncbi:MAG: serine hydrolase [Ignavibacteriaceae bacterium]
MIRVGTLKNLVSLSVFIFSISIGLNAQPNVISQVDSVMNHFAKQKMFSGVVLISIDNKPIYRKAFGFANYKEKIPNKLNTKFYIGATTQFLTAILTMQLVQDGKLFLSDTIGKYLPVFNKNGKSKVTILELLLNKSGFGNYAQDPLYTKLKDSLKSIEDFLPIIRKEKLEFEPGTKVSYSTSGFVILAAIIEKIYGNSFNDILKEKIFKPLKMDESGFDEAIINEDDRATGYKVLLNNHLESNLSLNTKNGGDSGIYTTAGDMLKLDNSLANDTILLSNENKLKLFTKEFTNLSNQSWKDYVNKETFGIEGSIFGFDAVWYRFFKEGYTIIVLSNFSQPSAEDVTYLIKMILFGRKYLPPRIPLERFVYNEIHKRGIENFVSNYGRIFNNYHYEVKDEQQLDNIGRELLHVGKKMWAIEILKLNAALFNYIPNVYNRLADVYIQNNDKKDAISNYRKALKIDTTNNHAAKMLASLGAF